jgi:hypothetical protein
MWWLLGVAGGCSDVHTTDHRDRQEMPERKYSRAVVEAKKKKLLFSNFLVAVEKSNCAIVGSRCRNMIYVMLLALCGCLHVYTFYFLRHTQVLVFSKKKIDRILYC